MLLAIDPGADSGWALFFKGVLISCGLGGDPAPMPTLRADGTALDLVIVEHPVIYPNGKTANPNDIVKVAISAGEWMGRYDGMARERRYVVPRDWKGTLDPDICNARTKARLDDGEKQVVEDALRDVPKKKQHNVLDAIGIGLFACGRWSR